MSLETVGIRLTCSECGKEFLRYPAHIRRNERRGITNTFCSRECQRAGRDFEPYRGEAHPQWKGGVDYRRRAIEHFGAYCHTCGYDREPSLLWVHHKDFGRTNHAFDNLEMLCIRCHLELHLERDRAISK